jgi:signal transduction histidine kinase
VSESKLLIIEPTGTRETTLKPKGTTLGRGANCDVILDHSSISRLHARIFQDPFGRWIIEDLDSRNGVFADGERVRAHVMSPGKKFLISHIAVSLPEESTDDSGRAPIRPTISIVDRGIGESIKTYKTEQHVMLSPALMQRLNELTAHLMRLSDPAELYSQACLRLAEMLNTLVAIVRLPCPERPLPDMPEFLACHFGDSESTTEILETTNLHMSKRVLDAIRSDDTPVMASSVPDSGKNMMLTIVDKQKPHVVFSARVNALPDTIDALYVDILARKSPMGTFDFIEAVARQINFIQKNLFLIELEKKEKALRETNTLLKEKDRIKDEYVARVTHDIKGHLAAIQSCLFVAASESSGSLNEKQSDFMKRATVRTKLLTDFVRELLNLTRMRLSGQVKKEAFSISDSISKALETVSQKAKDKSITLTSKVDPKVGQFTGDEFSISEMITNLLFNAIKYTPEGNTVHLEATRHDDHIRLDFIDTGIGIPANEMAHVFDEFFRATNAKKSEKDGTGLGLSIVKQIVERHGGTISVQSKETEGSTFTVMLPT